MRDTTKIVTAPCPKCGGNRKCDVLGDVSRPGAADDGSSWDDRYMILECRGCEKVFFANDYWFSEWDEVSRDETGREIRIIPGILSTYYPSPAVRPRPQWLEGGALPDQTLQELLEDIYKALDHDLRVMAAIGIRTALDRASVLFNLPENRTFAQKLDDMQADGRIGETEKGLLLILTDAGNAAAHRGWKPSPEDLHLMIGAIESLFDRHFVARPAFDQLKTAVPARKK